MPLILRLIIALLLMSLPASAHFGLGGHGGPGAGTTPVITFGAPSASYTYPSASGTTLTTVTATTNVGSFLGGGGTFTTSNCPASNIAVASAGAVTVAGPSNLTGNQSCTITANYPGATSVPQTFTLTGTQQTIASITPPCTLGSGCSYTFTAPVTSFTLAAVPTVTMSGGISFSAGGGTIVLGTGLQCSNYAISGSNLQITAASNGSYACTYVITDANASNSPQTPSITATGMSAAADLCSQTGVTCAYAYSTTNRVAVGAVKAFQLTRFSDSATLDVGFTGANNLTDTSGPAAFGCTIATQWLTVTPTCGYSIIYDQQYESMHGGSTGGCDAAQATTANMVPYAIWPYWGRPVAISTDQEISFTNAHYLTKTGCTAISSVAGGSGPRSIIVLGNNGYVSHCCGNEGFTEDAPSSGNIPTGAMWAWTWYQNLGIGTDISYGIDYEGGGTGSSDPNTPQTADVVGISTWSGDAGTHTANSYSNGYLNYTTTAPPTGKNCNGNTTYMCTQSRMTFGCDGDYVFCGPMFFATLAITTNDVTPQAAAITSFLQATKATFSPAIAIGGMQLLNTTVTASVPNAIIGYPTAFNLQYGGMFTGTLALVTSGNDYFGHACPSTDVQLLSTGGGNYVLEANGSTGESLGAHSFCIGATESGASNSPYVLPFTITGVAAPSNVGSIAAYNNSGSTTPGSTFPWHLFKAFKEGDVPAGNTVSLTVASSAIQFGEDCAFGASPTTAQKCPIWPDGSLRGAPFSVFLPQMANQAVDDIVFTTAAGTSDNSTTVTPATITALGDFRVVLSGVNDSWIPTLAEPTGVEIGCYVVAGSIPTGTSGCNLRITPPSTSIGSPEQTSCAGTSSGTCNTNIYGGLWNRSTPLTGDSVNGATLTSTLGSNGLPVSVNVTAGGSGYLAIGSGSMTLDTSVTLNKYGSIQPPTCSEDEGAGTFSSATYSAGSLVPTVTAGHIAKGQIVTDSTGATAVVTSGVSWIGGMTLPLNGLFMPAQGNAGHYTYKVTTSGTAGAAIPTSWNQTVSGTTSDGTATWTNEGLSTGWTVSAALTNGAMSAQTPLCVDAVSPTMIEYEGFAPYLDGSTPDASQRAYFWIRLWKQSGTAYSVQAGAYTSHFGFTPGVFTPSYTYDADIFDGTAEIRGSAVSGPNVYTRIVDKWPAGWFTNDPCLSCAVGSSGQMDWLGVTPNSATFHTANNAILNGVIPTLTSTDKLYDPRAWLGLNEAIVPSPLVVPLTNSGSYWNHPTTWQGFYYPAGPAFIDNRATFGEGGDHDFLAIMGRTFPRWELATTQATDKGASYFQQMVVNALGLAGITSAIMEDSTGHTVNIDPTYFSAGASDPYRYNANMRLFEAWGGPDVSGAGLGNRQGGVGDTSHLPAATYLMPYLVTGNRYFQKLIEWLPEQEQLEPPDDVDRLVTFGANTCYGSHWATDGQARTAAWMLVLMDQAAVWGNPNEPDSQYWSHQLAEWQHCTAELYPFAGTVTWAANTWSKVYDYTNIGAKETTNPLVMTHNIPDWIPFMEGYYEVEMDRQQLWFAFSNADINTAYNDVVINSTINRATENDCAFNFSAYGGVTSRTTDLFPEANWDATNLSTGDHENFQGNGSNLQSTSGSSTFVDNMPANDTPWGNAIPSGSTIKPLNYDQATQGPYNVPPTPLTEQKYIWCTISNTPEGTVSGTINPLGTTCPGNSGTWITATQTVNFHAGWIYKLDSCPSPQSGDWSNVGLAPGYSMEGNAATVWDSYVRRPDMNNTTAITGLNEQFPTQYLDVGWAARPH